MKKNLPRISVITPSYNQSAYIQATIESVLSQKYPNLEYLILDGGSTDSTVSILKKYEKHIRWSSKKDKGQSDAINKGMKLAKGEIICYLNSDDLFEKNCLNSVAAFFAEQPNYKWVTGKCHNINAKNEKLRSLVTTYKNIWLKNFRLNKTLFVLNYISQPATFWRREILETIGFLNTDLHYAMDYEYWIRIYQKYPLGFIDQYLALFRLHTASKTVQNLALQQKEAQEIISRYDNSYLKVAHSLHDAMVRSLYTLFPVS